MGLLEIFAGGAFALVEIGHGVEAQAIHAEIEPEVHDLDDFLVNFGIVEIQVRLMRKKPVPEISLGDVVPGPIGNFDVFENDARMAVLRRGVGPDVKVPPAAAGGRAAGALEPRVLIGGVVEHQLGDYAEPALVRLAETFFKIVERAIRRVYAGVVRDVVAVVFQRRGIERQEPDGGDAEVLDVIQLLGESPEIAGAVAVGIEEGADVDFVDDAALIPERLGAETFGNVFFACHSLDSKNYFTAGPMDLETPR